MYEENPKAVIEQHYLTNFNGPLFITAPHSKTLRRKGKQFDKPEQIHKREKYAGLIALKLATYSNIKKQNTASFMVWGSEKNQNDPDPNYLKENMFANSVFHQGLHKWASQHKGSPLFHIDLHGKVDSDIDCVIQVGTKASGRIFKNQELTNSFISYFNVQFKDVFAGWQFRGRKCEFNSKNPRFKGSWDQGIYTMADQSARMGIPSVQLQIPYQVRQRLVVDQSFFKKFRKCLLTVYRKVIIPFSDKLQPPKVNDEYADSIKQSVNDKDTKILIKQIEKFEKKKSKKSMKKKQ